MTERISEEIVAGLPKPETGNRCTFFAGHALQGTTCPPGFGVRVTAGGAKAFVLDYRHKGKQRRYTIGLWKDSPGGGSWSVIAAIKAARDLRQQIDNGNDPQAEKEAARSPQPHGKTVKDVLEDFVKRHVNAKLRTARQVERTLERLVIPRIGKLGIGELRRAHVAEMLDEIEDESGAVTADRTLAYLRKGLNWHATRDDEFSSPIVKGMARTVAKEHARSRNLSDDELRDLHAALNQIDKPACLGKFVRTLLLTSCRLREVGNMTWGEIDADTWTIPAARHKSRLDHVVPLTATVRALVGTPDKPKPGAYVFSTDDGHNAFSGFSKSKTLLDAKIAELRAKEGREAMLHWTYHDLRRTARSLMSRAGIASDTAERVLGHVMPGVRGVYDRHAYLAEKRDALERLAALVELILAVKGDVLARAEAILKESKPGAVDVTAIVASAENAGANVVTLKAGKQGGTKKRRVTS